MGATQIDLRLANLLEERDTLRARHEAKLAEIATRDKQDATHEDKELLRSVREQAEDKDGEINELIAERERDEVAREQSKAVRRALAGNVDGIEADGDEIVYRDFASFARDFVITRQSEECSKIGTHVGSDEVERARQRLQLMKRTPANTLTSDIPGLQPEQHISQIFQTINKSRPLVASAFRTNLERGSFTFPKITQRPVVAVQSAEKTEAGNQKMTVAMETATASTYLGGGDLSWQALNWSTPDALALWFDLAAADYALKTEQDAGEVLQTAAFSNNIASTLAATPTYPQFMTGVAAGLGEVYANSGDMADTLYLAPDRAAYLIGLTASEAAVFANGSLSFAGGSGNVAGLNVVISRGLDSGVMAVGVARKLIVAETGGAPVELRVVEPAIGGVEVGIIGAFEAVVAEDEAFSLLTTAS